jgi:hypothetical protein
MAGERAAFMGDAIGATLRGVKTIAPLTQPFARFMTGAILPVDAGYLTA